MMACIKKLNKVMVVTLVVFTCFMFVLAPDAFATQPSAQTTTAENLWKAVSDIVGTWVTRLGGVVMFIGGVMFALGWKNDDAEQKSRGVSTLIAGGIVLAVAAMTGTFFA